MGMETDAKVRGWVDADGHRTDDVDGYIDLAHGVVDVCLGGPGGEGDEAHQRKQLAGILLHGQPFGFTREDVALIREAAKSSEFWEDPATWPGMYDVVPNKRLADLADRIAALLPPEEP